MQVLRVILRIRISRVNRVDNVRTTKLSNRVWELPSRRSRSFRRGDFVAADWLGDLLESDSVIGKE